MTGTARTTAIGALTSSDGCEASNYNQGPGGLIGYLEITANSSGTGTTENYGVINDVPVNSGRMLLLVAVGTQRASGPTGLQTKWIEDSTDLNRIDNSVSGSGLDAAFCCVSLAFPSAGNHDYTLAGGIDGTGPTATLIASGTRKCIMAVIDIGPSFF